MNIAKNKDSLQRSPTFTLSLRIFLTSLALLALPLFLHTLWMYRSEYKESRKELFLFLFEEGQARLFLMEETVRNQESFLSLVKENLNPDNDAGWNTFFNVWAENFHAKVLLYLQLENGQLLSSASSDRELVGKDFSFLKEGLQKKNFLSLGDLGSEKLFYVGLTLYDGAGEAMGALVVGNPAEGLLKRLETIDKIPYPIHLSLIDKEGKVAISTDPLLEKKKVPLASREFVLEKQFAVLLPIENSSYSLLTTAPEKRITAAQNGQFMKEIFSFLLFFIVLGGAAAFFLTYRFARPMKQLFQTIDQIGAGHTRTRCKKDPWGFEINALGDHINQMMNSLLKHQKIAEEERVQKEIFEEELRIGHEIQKGMLPTHLPEVKGLDIATGFSPAKEVGGDFYDLFLQGNELFFSIADTSGKGISSCLYSLGMRSMLRSFSTLSRGIGQTLLQANNLFYKDASDQGMFVTVWMGKLDLNTNHLVYSSAGHYPALLKRNGKVESLTTEGIALGAIPLEKIPTGEIQLEEGDLLLLYTDGIVEATDSEGKAYGMKRLEEFLLKKEEKPSRYIAQDLLHEIKNFTGGKAQEDDLTFVIMRVAKGHSFSNGG